MARPTKWTAERQKRICDDLRIGCTRRAASEANGICQETFTEWTKRFPGFLDAVREAEADAERSFTRAVKKAADDGDPKAAVEWLKRRRRDDYGDSITHDIDAEIAGLLAAVAGTRQAPTA